MRGDFSAEEPLSFTQEIHWMGLPQDYALNRLRRIGKYTNQLQIGSNQNVDFKEREKSNQWANNKLNAHMASSTSQCGLIANLKTALKMTCS